MLVRGTVTREVMLVVRGPVGPMQPVPWLPHGVVLKPPVVLLKTGNEELAEDIIPELAALPARDE